MARLLKIDLDSTPIHVQYADSQSDAFRAKESVIFKFGDRSVKTKPLVMNCSRQVIIGQDELKGLNVSLHYSQHGVEINSISSKCPIVEDIKSQYSSIMSSHRFDIGTCKIYAPRLQFIKEDLSSNPRYDPNPKLMDTLREEYLKMVEFRHIIPVSKSNKMPKYICNIVPVEKKNGDLRITFDLRKVNEILVPFHYSSPKLCHYLMHFSGYDFISKLDLVSAYSQIMYHPDDQHIIGGHFNNNIFSIPRLTMGGKNSSSIFQAVFDQILQGTAAASYQDDAWIFTSGSYEKHKSEVLKVCYALQQHGLKINVDKCQFAATEVEILGHQITRSGTRIASKFVKAISEFPIPHNIYQLRKFRGIFTFVKRYFHDTMEEERLIDKCIGNTPKSRGKSSTNISSEVVHAIKSIQSKALHTTSLAHPNYSLPFILFVDASLRGTGAGLFQPSSDHFIVSKPFSEPLHCVALYSKKHEYKVVPPIVALELKAISDALSYFGEMIITCPVHVYTDHKNLLTIIQESTSLPYGKYIHNILCFSPASINYLPGSVNCLADSLSRVHLEEEKEKAEFNYIESSLPKTKGNNSIQDTARQLYEEVHCNLSHVCLAKVYAISIQSLTKTFHKKATIKNIFKSLKGLIGRCSICRENNTLKRRKIPDCEDVIDLEPFETIHLDVTYIDKTPLISMIDRLSKYVVAKVIKEASANTVCSFLREHVFLKHGIPRRIHSDCAKCFLSKEFQSLCTSHGISHTMGVPGEHYSNQNIERYFRTLKLNLTKHMAEKGSGWKSSYQLVIFNYNSTPLSLSLVSPNDIIYGYKVVNLSTRNFASKDPQAKDLQKICMDIEKLPSTVIIKDPRSRTSNQTVHPIKVLNDRNMIVSKSSDARTNQIGSLFKYRVPEVNEGQVTGAPTQDF